MAFMLSLDKPSIGQHSYIFWSSPGIGIWNTSASHPPQIPQNRKFYAILVTTSNISGSNPLQETPVLLALTEMCPGAFLGHQKEPAALTAAGAVRGTACWHSALPLILWHLQTEPTLKLSAWWMDSFVARSKTHMNFSIPYLQCKTWLNISMLQKGRCRWNLPWMGLVCAPPANLFCCFHLSISAPELAALCRNIILITASRSIFIWTTHFPPVPPRCGSATAAQLRVSFEGTQKVTSSSQQISCWFCAQKNTAFPQKIPSLW